MHQHLCSALIHTLLYLPIFTSPASLPIQAYACVLEMLKCLNPLQLDSWGHRSQTSRENASAVGQVVAALLSCGLLVAHFSQWRGGWNCRLFLEHRKWRWCDTQIGYNCLWPSLLECAWDEQTSWAGSRLLWLCVVHWEVIWRRRKAKISGFDQATAAISGKSDSQLLGSSLCKARWVWPSLWVLGTLLGGAAGEQRDVYHW